MLRIRRFGHGQSLVALHGFTLTGDQFSSFGDLLGREVVAPDLPGHGESRNAPSRFEDVVDAVCDLTSSFAHPVPLLGYSQGGRLALATALQCASSVERLVLISATAGIEQEQLRRNRATQDDALAAQIEMIGVERFVNEWTAAGLTSTQGMEPADRERDRRIRLDNTAQGLASAVRGYGQGAQPVFWPELHALALPVLVVAGADDAKYADLAIRMTEQIPHAELAIVSHAGHNPLIDNQGETVDVISAFLNRDRRP